MLSCLSLDNAISLLQLAAVIVIGIFTIRTYYRITRISSDATIQAAKLNDDSNRFNKLNHDLDKIVDLTIQYPYFEDEDYIKNYYKNDLVSSDSEKKNNALRYELFAMRNFNLIEDLHRYFNGDESKMEDLFNFQEIIESHSTYWKYKIIEKKEGGYKRIKKIVNRIIKEYDGKNADKS